MDQIQFLTNMFPTLERDVIADVLVQQKNDVDKTIDELLNLAVGDDLFARSVYVEEKLSASTQLRDFDARQERILQECRENKERALREKEEKERREKEERERRAIEERERREEQERLRRIQEQQRIEAENQKIVEEERLRKELLKKQEEEARLAVMQKEEELRKREEESRLRQKQEEDRLLAEKRQIAEMMTQQERAAREERQAALKLKEETDKARAAVEAEKQAILEEKKRLQEEKERLEEEKKANRPSPKLRIYTLKVQDEAEANSREQTADEIKNLFTSNGFSEDEIEVVDVSTDIELASYLKEICNNSDTIKYPLVCAGNLPIGTITEVRELVANKEKLSQLQEGNYVPDFLTEDQVNSLKEGNAIPNRGVLDHLLDFGEGLVSGFSTLLWLPVNVVTYPFRSAKEELKKGADDVDFNIVHTNWYWRNLVRTFRFTKDSILRIHPSHNDVRASHSYITIDTIKVVDAENIVINYKDSSSPDYVHAPAEAISDMLKLIKTRSGALGCKPIILREDEL